MNFSQALFEAIGDSAILLDRCGRIMDWNNGAQSLFGYTKEEVLGRSINVIYAYNHRFSKIIRERLPRQRKWSAETSFVHKNGTRGHCKTILSLIHRSPSHKKTVLMIHQNITTYKNHESKMRHAVRQTLNMYSHYHALILQNIAVQQKLERALSESELRFDLLAENTTDMISQHSPDGIYLYVSPAANNLLGYSPEELMGSNKYKLLHSDDINKFKKIFNRRKPLHTYRILTYRIKHKEGEYRWFESHIRFIKNELTKDAREIQIASRDITDRVMDKKARLRGQQLAHVFRLSTMEEMASGMAHEISQPLAAIVNYTQGCVRYLQRESHDPIQLIEIMNKAVSQAERAGEVIHRLKNFFCKGQLVKTPCKISALLRETVGLIRNDLNNSKTKIEFELMKDIPTVFIDKIQLQQVILNLLQNAIEAMKEIPPKNRKIHIQGSAIENAIEISVTDSGPGFSKEITNKVFKPFFTTKAHGRGMGLAICRSIIEAHGGEFAIKPNSNGRSWIKFMLPITKGI